MKLPDDIEIMFAANFCGFFASLCASTSEHLCFGTVEVPRVVAVEIENLIKIAYSVNDCI